MSGISQKLTEWIQKSASQAFISSICRIDSAGEGGGGGGVEEPLVITQAIDYPVLNLCINIGNRFPNVIR